MKKLLFAVIICALGYYGYTVYQKKLADEAAARATPPPAAPTPVPKRLAPAGTFFVMENISVTNDTGVTGISPGTQVTLVQDKGATKIVSDGKNQFEVTPAQITNDLDVAQQLRPGGGRLQNVTPIVPAGSSPLLVTGTVGSTQGIVPAQEVKFDQYNFAFTPPAGWVRQYPPNLPALVAAYTNPDHTAQLMVVVDNSASAPIVMNDAFVSDFNKGVEESGGGTLLSGSFVQAAGVKCYQRTGVMTVSGKTISTFGIAIPSGKTVYGVQGMRFDGTASDLPELRKSIDSFRFLNLPSQ